MSDSGKDDEEEIVFTEREMKKYERFQKFQEQNLKAKVQAKSTTASEKGKTVVVVEQREEIIKMDVLTVNSTTHQVETKDLHKFKNNWGRRVAASSKPETSSMRTFLNYLDEPAKRWTTLVLVEFVQTPITELVAERNALCDLNGDGELAEESDLSETEWWQILTPKEALDELCRLRPLEGSGLKGLKP